MGLLDRNGQDWFTAIQGTLIFQHELSASHFLPCLPAAAPREASLRNMSVHSDSGHRCAVEPTHVEVAAKLKLCVLLKHCMS